MRRYYVIFMSFERIDVDCIDECDVLIFLVMLVLREGTGVISCVFRWKLLYFHHMSIFVLDDSASSHCDEINMCMMLCQAFCDTSFCMYFNRLHAAAPRSLIILPHYLLGNELSVLEQHLPIDPVKVYPFSWSKHLPTCHAGFVDKGFLKTYPCSTPVILKCLHASK